MLHSRNYYYLKQLAGIQLEEDIMSPCQWRRSCLSLPFGPVYCVLMTFPSRTFIHMHSHYYEAVVIIVGRPWWQFSYAPLLGGKRARTSDLICRKCFGSARLADNIRSALTKLTNSYFCHVSTNIILWRESVCVCVCVCVPKGLIWMSVVKFLEWISTLTKTLFIAL